MKYGKSSVEIDAEKLVECRKIVRNIIDFGVTEAQKIQLIYLFGLELESRESLELVTQAIKKIRNIDEESNFNLTQETLEYNSDDTDTKDTKSKKILVI